MKKMYNIIKDATYENQTKDLCIKINNEQGQEFTNSIEMANYCNNYFINIGIDMEKNIPIPKNSCSLDPINPNSMFLTPITKNELVKHISSLKSSGCPGYDGISTQIIKQTHMEIMTPLLHIINLIFKTGIVPSDFKMSIVTPIHKNGPKTDIKNYRPISVISNFSKIFEKCFKEKLTMFFNKNDILSDDQYGFMNGSSTSDALHRFATEIINNLNTGNKCIGVFLDLAKAFDTVPHKKLLDVLIHYGVRGTVSKLIESYLTNRSQVVKINKILSDRQIIKIGVPQGTVLGPILFITYLNSLLRQNIGGSVISYADDTVLIFSGRDWDETKNKVVRGLKIIKNWLHSHKLTLNLTKTNYISFSLTAAGRPLFSYITIDDNKINEVSSTKYLGVIIDQFLKWQPHIDYLTNKIRKLIHKFYLLREFLNTKILIMLYKAFVESLLRYGILVWGGLYNNALYKLNTVQKFILKIIYKKNKTYSTKLLFSEETPNIRTLYMITICVYIHIRNSLREHIDHSYDTRSKLNKKLKIPLNHKNINLKYINYLAPKIYNLLPNVMKEIKNKKKFKKECNKYIFSNFDRFVCLFY